MTKWVIPDTPSPEAIVRATAARLTGKMIYDAFVKHMNHAYVDEDFIELAGVCMDGYFNLLVIAEELRNNLASNPAEVAAIIKRAGEDSNT
jgi:hypothetical protein